MSSLSIFAGESLALEASSPDIASFGVNWSGTLYVLDRSGATVLSKALSKKADLSAFLVVLEGEETDLFTPGAYRGKVHIENDLDYPYKVDKILMFSLTVK